MRFLRSCLVGIVVGAVEGAIYATAEGIAILHLLAFILLPLPLGIGLASLLRLPRPVLTGLLGTVAFAALLPAISALPPGDYLYDLPRAFDAIPILVAALIGYVVAAWALTRRTWWHGVAVALGVAGFVTAVLFGRVAIADWHTERALEASGVPLYDIPGLAPTSVYILDRKVWVEYPRASVTIRRTGTPQEECVKPGDQPYTCREIAPGRWTRSEAMGVTLFAARDGRLIEVASDEEYPAVWTLDHLTPTTAHALLSHRRPT